jgi:hypothetical protein
VRGYTRRRLEPRWFGDNPKRSDAQLMRDQLEYLIAHRAKCETVPRDCEACVRYVILRSGLMIVPFEE